MLKLSSPSIPLIVLLACGSAMAGCTTRTYIVGETEFGIADEEWRSLAPKLKTAKPDKVTEVSAGERLLIFYSGKTLLMGAAIAPSQSEKERVIIKERDGQMILWHRVMQYVEVHHFSCGNISGHGTFCATEVYRQCENWGNRTLRDASCPIEVGEPLH